MRPRLLTVLVVVALLVACAGSLEEPERFAIQESFSSESCVARTAALFADRCVGCHNAESPGGGLNLDVTGVGQALVGMESSGCEGHVLLDPADPASSLIYTKMVAPPSGCGSVMPVGGAELPTEELDCVLEWIALQGS